MTDNPPDVSLTQLTARPTDDGFRATVELTVDGDDPETVLGTALALADQPASPAPTESVTATAPEAAGASPVPDRDIGEYRDDITREMGERYTPARPDDADVGEDGYLVTESSGREVLVRPQTRPYHVLYLAAWHLNSTGETTFTSTALKALTDELGHGTVISALKGLTAASLVERVGGGGTSTSPYRYKLTDVAIDYLRTHGEPEGFEVPDNHPDA